MNRQTMLGALVVALVLALYLLSVAVGAGDDGDIPADSDGLASVRDAIGALPGFGSKLEAEDVEARDRLGRICFDEGNGQFVLAQTGAVCIVSVPEGVDFVRLRALPIDAPADRSAPPGSCRIQVVQPDVFDDELVISPASEEEEVSLAGDGATLTISDGPCALELNPA